MLLAAGLGTRMRPLTDDRPKPLIAVAGKPLIDHALDLVRAAGVTRIVVNTHYRAAQLEAHLQGTGITTIHEPELLETGGGLRNALPLLGDGPVWVMNPDAIYAGPNPLEQLATAWDPNRMEALQLLIPTDRAIGQATGGDWDIGPEGRLSRGKTHIYSGLHITHTNRLAAIPDRAFSLNRVWDQMIAAGGLYGTEYPGAWCDVGRPESIPLAEAMLTGGNV